MRWGFICGVEMWWQRSTISSTIPSTKTASPYVSGWYPPALNTIAVLFLWHLSVGNAVQGKFILILFGRISDDSNKIYSQKFIEWCTWFRRFFRLLAQKDGCVEHKVPRHKCATDITNTRIPLKLYNVSKATYYTNTFWRWSHRMTMFHSHISWQ